jgi:hypothetical protein
MEGVGARLGRTSARYGPATTFTGHVRKWRKEWVPVVAAAAAAAANANTSANGGTTSSTGMGSGGGSRGNNLLLFKWTPVNGANGGGGDGEQQQQAETATRRRRYVPVRILEKIGWLTFVPSGGAMWVRICNMIGSFSLFSSLF